MNLAYRLEDKLFWVHNFLPQRFYKELHDMVFKSHKEVNKSADEIWSDGLLKNLKVPQRLNLNETFSKQYTTLLKHQPFVNLTVVESISFIAHKMTQYCGINWHDDQHTKYATTFYINKRWNDQWGGEFMFKTQQQSGFIPVVGNSLVISKTPLMHKVNPVLSPTIPRFTIQSFIR